MAAAKRTRLDYVDGVRALAAVYVVLHHIWITTYPQYPRNSGPVIVGWLLYGHLAVAVFIVVSGFSLSIAPSRRGWQLSGGLGTFIRRRAWRILPTYWAALAFSCIVFGVVTRAQTGHDVSLKAIAVHGLLLQDVINSPKPNGAFWSIAIEWQIYFLFPVFLLLRRRIGSALFTLSATAAVVATYEAATHVGSLHRLLNLTPQFAALFVFGIAAAGLAHDEVGVVVQRLMPWLAGALALGALAVCVVKGSAWVDSQYFWVDLLVGGSTALAVAGLAHGRPRSLRRLLASAVLRKTGLFSYSIYCVHLPILWLVWHFGITRFDLSTDQQFVALLVVGLPCAIAGSYLFSLVFEKPFLTHRSFSALRDLLTARARTGSVVSPVEGGRHREVSTATARGVEVRHAVSVLEES